MNSSSQDFDNFTAEHVYPSSAHTSFPI